MYQGQNAIDYLISQVNIEDPAASSHWQKYHSNFEVNNGVIKGIEGLALMRALIKVLLNSQI